MTATTDPHSTDDGPSGERPSDLAILGFDTPTDLTSAVTVIADLAYLSVEHLTCPVWCEECLVWETHKTCGSCSGSGCSPATALGAFDPCGFCAGDGRHHPGSSDSERARKQALADVTAAIDAQIQSHPESGSHSRADHGAVRALADLRARLNAPEFATTGPPPPPV